jgi:hypothetical protein
MTLTTLPGTQTLAMRRALLLTADCSTQPSLPTPRDRLGHAVLALHFQRRRAGVRGELPVGRTQPVACGSAWKARTAQARVRCLLNDPLARVGRRRRGAMRSSDKVHPAGSPARSGRRDCSLTGCPLSPLGPPLLRLRCAPKFLLIQSQRGLTTRAACLGDACPVGSWRRVACCAARSLPRIPRPMASSPSRRLWPSFGQAAVCRPAHAERTDPSVLRRADCR